MVNTGGSQYRLLTFHISKCKVNYWLLYVVKAELNRVNTGTLFSGHHETLRQIQLPNKQHIDRNKCSPWGNTCFIRSEKTPSLPWTLQVLPLRMIIYYWQKKFPRILNQNFLIHKHTESQLFSFWIHVKTSIKFLLRPRVDPFYNELSYLVTNEYLPFALSLQSIGKKKGMRSLTLFFCITKGQQKMRVIYILLPSSLIMCETQRKEPLPRFILAGALTFFLSLSLAPQLAVVFTFCLKEHKSFWHWIFKGRSSVLYTIL